MPYTEAGNEFRFSGTIERIEHFLSDGVVLELFSGGFFGGRSINTIIISGFYGTFCNARRSFLEEYSRNVGRARGLCCPWIITGTKKTASTNKFVEMILRLINRNNRFIITHRLVVPVINDKFTTGILQFARQSIMFMYPRHKIKGGSPQYH